jgi:O-antigen/teichoic acid export membrane protein
LGVEAFGLVGLYTTIYGVSAMLDMGFGITLNREMARLSVRKNSAQEQWDLLRTLESLYWLLALVGGFSIMVLAPFIAHHWLTPQRLSSAELESAIKLMGWAVLLKLPFMLYQGGLRGLQRQVLENGLLMTIGTLRGIGAVAVLFFISSTVQAFFVWQILVNFVATTSARLLLRRSLPNAPGRPRFSRELLTAVWPFASAQAGNAVCLGFCTQIDKVFLSRLVNLETFGFYTLASSVAYSLISIVYPISNAAFPRLVQLTESGDETELANLYHRISQFISVILLPTAIVLIFFSKEILLLWTRDPVVARNSWLLLSLLATGVLLNCLGFLPGYLQAAMGWPQLLFYTNLCLAILLVPGVWFMGSHFGATGVAQAFLMLNSIYLLFNVPLMHLRFLKAEKWRWYEKDVALPLIGALIVGLAGRFLFPAHASMLTMVTVLAGIFFLGLFSSAMLAPEIRAALILYVTRTTKPIWRH